MNSNLLHFLMCICFVIISRNHSLAQAHKHLHKCILPEFQGCGSSIYTFDPFSIFSVEYEVRSRFILLHVDSLLFQHHLLKEYSSLIDLSWHYYKKLIDHRHMGLYLDSEFQSTELCVYPYISAHVFCYFTILLSFFQLY